MSLVMSEMARADGTSSKQARRKVKKKEAAYHMSAVDPRQAEEHRDLVGEEIESRLASASDLLSRGRYDEALALALDTLSVDSMDHKAAYLAGVCHLQKRQGELAIKYLTSATTMAPYNALYRNHLGTYSHAPRAPHTTRHDTSARRWLTICELQGWPTCIRKSGRWRWMSTW
jgi:Flp pilus assembly protein TadD